MRHEGKRCMSSVNCQGLTLYTLKGLFSGFKYCEMLESIFVMLFSVFYCLYYDRCLAQCLISSEQWYYAKFQNHLYE